MSGIPIDHPMAGDNTGSRSQQRRPDGSWHLRQDDAPSPPDPPPAQEPTVGPGWRITIGAAWAIAAFVVPFLLFVAWQQWEIRQSIKDLRYGVWTIEDQEEFARLAAQGGLMLPDPREVVRRRLPGPIHLP